MLACCCQRLCTCLGAMRAVGSFCRGAGLMQRFPVSLVEMAASLWRHWQLARVLVQREVMGRYRGSVLGILGSVFDSVVMLAVHTFVFNVGFKTRCVAVHRQGRVGS
ncbi:MAG: sugar transporter permease [Polaromonas sp.]|jgi:hypothetical protein|nr:sugar transporter permease [Polaromonas sp.]MDB5846148.1 sugar transporter permease [Polaromonas sp.]MDB5940306.1 sugar transporter permease [Polaromonas sp.]